MMNMNTRMASSMTEEGLQKVAAHYDRLSCHDTPFHAALKALNKERLAWATREVLQALGEGYNMGTTDTQARLAQLLERMGGQAVEYKTHSYGSEQYGLLWVAGKASAKVIGGSYRPGFPSLVITLPLPPHLSGVETTVNVQIPQIHKT